MMSSPPMTKGNKKNREKVDWLRLQKTKSRVFDLSSLHLKRGNKKIPPINSTLESSVATALDGISQKSGGVSGLPERSICPINKKRGEKTSQPSQQRHPPGVTGRNSPGQSEGSLRSTSAAWDEVVGG